jgi:transcriptional repressor NrdR
MFDKRLRLGFFAFHGAKRYLGRPMRCPFCDADKESLKVIDSRSCDGGKSIRRRRQCLRCAKRFTTYERVESTIRLTVIKKDGRRVPWERTKILIGLERACFKRPVPESELNRIADEVEEETYRRHDREIPSSFVGTLVADKLRRVDQVAYVRFASVYRQFKTLEELVDEARAVLDARRYDDPEQGKLFIDPESRPKDREDGSPVARADGSSAPPAPERGTRRPATRRRIPVDSAVRAHPQEAQPEAF